MKKRMIVSLLAVSLLTISGCSNPNLSEHENKGDDVIQGNSSSFDIGDQTIEGGEEGSINDFNSNTEGNRITGTDIFVEKCFLNVDELTSFFSTLNVSSDTNFIVPNYSCQDIYDYYYYFKGTCNGEEYEKNPENVEYTNYIFGGVLYSIDEQGEKIIVYSLDVLANNPCYNAETDTIEYAPDLNKNNIYLGYLNGKPIFKLHFEIENKSYTEIISETIKSYCMINRDENI